MKNSQKVLAAALAGSLALSAVAPIASAEVSGSVGVASTYLWRGVDLGSGTPAVSGSLDYSASGFYAGIWGSSGDTANGTEYDLYLGYGGEAGKFSYDLSVWTYSYPTGAAQEELGTPGNLAEAVIALGYGPVSFSYFDAIAAPTDDAEDYTYMTLGLSLEAFSVTYGVHNEQGLDLSHIDFSYAYNDNLSFTISAQIDNDNGDLEEGDEGYVGTTDPTFVVSYSMPIE
ncbi:conserved hypothetical protein [Alteromonadaceae bacterium Bs31]|nr:conserved hypothetical protein [Alteromonadaceae bacterium Bs31]